MSNITPFSSDEFELSILPDGDSFRVLAPGLAHALGMRDATRLLESIPGAEKGCTTACTPGGEQRVGYVTEAGFYRALGQRQAARVKDPEIRAQVERFQTWVYTEVLPAIRRTGTYATRPQPQLSEDEIVHQALQITARRVEQLEAAGKVLVIYPENPLEVDRFGTRIDQLEALYEEGYACAERIFSQPQTQRFLAGE